jgi:hypothetical protein
MELISFLMRIWPRSLDYPAYSLVDVPTEIPYCLSCVVSGNWYNETSISLSRMYRFRGATVQFVLREKIPYRGPCIIIFPYPSFFLRAPDENDDNKCHYHHGKQFKLAFGRRVTLRTKRGYKWKQTTNIYIINIESVTDCAVSIDWIVMNLKGCGRGRSRPSSKNIP